MTFCHFQNCARVHVDGVDDVTAPALFSHTHTLRKQQQTLSATLSVRSGGGPTASTL